MFEAMITNTWLASQTERLRVGSLVLCDSFRHPAVLAREAVSIDHASGGRFELGHRLGLGGRRAADVRHRVAGGEGRGWAGCANRSRSSRRSGPARRSTTRASTSPCTARSRCPVRSGTSRSSSAGRARERCSWSPRTPTGGTCTRTSSTSSTRCARSAGNARCSLQAQVAFVPPPASRDEIEATARRRFGATPIVGTAPELVDYFGSLQERGVERVYAWFCDFAAPETRWRPSERP